LASLFQGILAKTAAHKGIIHEEFWKVSDKITLLKELLQGQKIIPFETIFSSEKSREELIVTFLALLELMKTGEARIINDRTLNAVCILATH
jgi:segregation and condensation protein A